MTTSKPLYIYLQRPDTGEWVTVGRYSRDANDTGLFRYAPTYLNASLPWAIDPINLPLIGGMEHYAQRYQGLHDVLRDTCPDSWGRLLLQRKFQLSDNAHDSDYLRVARNGDRWGALAVGTSRKPSVDIISSPQLIQLESLAKELLAMYERRPPVNTRMRKMLMATPSMGGARPKGTLQDGDDYWLVKPILPGDTADIPLLEHFALSWGAAAGMRFAKSVHYPGDNGLSVVRIHRYDRHGNRRRMAISAASLLGAEYPGGRRSEWSYPRLAQTLQRVGAPVADRIELFDRMVFNAVVGNDDDHPRNHAAIYEAEQSCWRLSPAFDVVPNPDDEPLTLSMQVSQGRFDISRDTVLADAHDFGFQTQSEAQQHLDELLIKISDAYDAIATMLPNDLRALLSQRLARVSEALRSHCA